MATAFCTPLDNVSSTVGAAYAAAAGQLTVAAGDGAKFGTPSAAAPVRFSVTTAANVTANGTIVNASLVAAYKATGRTGDTLTGLTLTDGTDQPFSVGDKVWVGETAATFTDLHTAVNNLENTVSYVGQAQTITGVKTFSPSAGPTSAIFDNANSVSTVVQWKNAGTQHWQTIISNVDNSFQLVNTSSGNQGLVVYKTANPSVALGTSPLATTAVDGFVYIPTCAGAPTGVPTARGGSPLVFDTTNNKLWIYNGTWKGVVLA